MNLVDEFIIYIVRSEGKIVYIGSGKFGRHLHCKSGCSHVYGLNKLHFSGADMDVEITAYYDSKKDSLEAERLLIVRHKPMFNKRDNPDVKIISTGVIYEKWDDYLRINVAPRKYKVFTKVILELINYFGINNLTSESGVNLKGLVRHKRIPNSILPFLACKRGKRISYSKYKDLYEVLCAVEGFVKLPTTPILTIDKETNDTTN